MVKAGASHKEDILSTDQNFWANYDPSGAVTVKAELIRKRIPEGVRSIADIGAGNGIITNLLSKDFDVTAVDISEEALQFVTTKKILASATELPFEDNSYDLVMSNQMLEHLPSLDLHRAIREMKRVSRRYLLISVPHKEQLVAENVKCPKCSRIFNAYGHIQSFHRKRLLNLFSGYNVLAEDLLGQPVRDYPQSLLKIRQSLGGQWYQGDFPGGCPQCGNTEFPPSANLITKSCNLISRLVTCERPYWIMLLLEMNTST